jgi:hypothetical protein
LETTTWWQCYKNFVFSSLMVKQSKLECLCVFGIFSD